MKTSKTYQSTTFKNAKQYLKIAKSYYSIHEKINAKANLSYNGTPNPSLLYVNY